MAQNKRKFFVYLNEEQNYGDGRTVQIRKLAGSTFAVSEKQAVNFFCYRYKQQKNFRCFWGGGGGRETWYSASEQEYEDSIVDSLYPAMG